MAIPGGMVKGGGVAVVVEEDEVEEEEEEKKPKTKKVEKTVWDWELMNDIKPIWQRPSKEVDRKSTRLNSSD